MNDNLPYWLAALYLPGVGPRRFLQWLKRFSHISTIFKASSDELCAKGIAKQFHAALQYPDWHSIEGDLAWVNEFDHYLLAYDDPGYPPLLKEIADPPLVLYLRGNQSAILKTQLAIVGSRQATCIGLKNAEQFAFQLAEAGFTITSGLALGIDAASHRGALKAKGLTIAVFGTGLNHIYPSRHKKLAEDMIAQEGAIVSEFPLNIPVFAANFPRRNRIISGLCFGVLVVEAARKSGSLITAQYALDQGREVFAIPSSIHNPVAKGCHHLIQQGAKLVENVNDILDELTLLSNAFTMYAVEDKKKPVLDNAADQVLAQIGYEITSMDVITLRSGLTGSEVSSILLALELNGYIQFVSGGYIRVG